MAETLSETNLEEFTELDRGWIAAYLQGTPDLINRIWPEGFLFTLPFGRFCNREREISNLNSGVLSVKTLSSDHVSVSVYGRTAIMFGDFTMSGRYEDRDISGCYSYTNVLRRQQDDQWQIIASQASELD